MKALKSFSKNVHQFSSPAATFRSVLRTLSTKTEYFVKIVNDKKNLILKKLTEKLNILTESSIFDVSQGFETPPTLLQKLVPIASNFPGNFENCRTREQAENIIAKFELWFKILD